MKRSYEEKCKNTFWLRPAFGNNSRSNATSTRTRVLLVSVSAFLFAFVMTACWLDLSLFSCQSILQFQTPKKVHDFPDLDCLAWNQTLTCPKNNYPKFKKNPNRSSITKCPDYFRWIHEDLRHWRDTGITRDMVDRAKSTAHFRLIIIDGKAYIEKFRKSIQSRDLFTLWGFQQLLRRYPGKVPDLELMFDCNDRPVINDKRFRGPNGAPPLFKYCSDRRSLDIVTPDWSFWGWPETNQKPWEVTLKEIKEGNKKVKWMDREPYAYWKGNPSVSPIRVDLKKCNVNHTTHFDWNTRLFFQDWANEVTNGFKNSHIKDQCTYRFKIYVEGWAWSVSEKYILACDSPTLYITPRFHTFFARGLVPLKHFWPIRDTDKCKSLKFAVDWGNNHTSKAQEMGVASSRFIQEDVSMEYVYDYMLHLLIEYAKLLKFKPSVTPNTVKLCPKSMACQAAEQKSRDFLLESLVQEPADRIPCDMPPPYDLSTLKDILDNKTRVIKQVETWEDEFWKNQNIK